MRSVHSIIRYFLAAAVVLTAAACSSGDDGIVLGGGGSKPAQPTGSLAARLEMPAPLAGNRVIAHWTISGTDSILTYCLEYDSDKYHSRWVAFRFDGATRARNVGRKDYSIRPQYPRDPQLTDRYIEDDASFNGYQHGHLCASADRLYSRLANDQTFYMTNMSPQKGDFNGGYWTRFEEFVQRCGRSAAFADTLYVVKGGTIAEGQYSHRVARSRMVVPKYYFIALLKVKNNVYSAVAFWVKHDSYGYDFDHQAPASVVAEHAVSVDELEELTGIDFFHNLPDAVESTVESGYVAANWGL